MTSLKALLFDLDGTLIETEDINAEAYGQALMDFGFTFAHKDVKEVIIGRHWSYFLPIFTDSSDDALFAKLVKRKQEIYVGLLNKARINSSLIDLINSSFASFKIGIVTTASKDAVDIILPRLGLKKAIDCIVNGSDVKQRKPAPDAYHLAAVSLGVTPSECLVFEDSEVGIQSALDFGASVLQVRQFH